MSKKCRCCLSRPGNLFELTHEPMPCNGLASKALHECSTTIEVWASLVQRVVGNVAVCEPPTVITPQPVRTPHVMRLARRL